MAVNKVEFGNQTVMDITDTTVTSDEVIEGQVFYAASGLRSVGTLGDATQSTHGLMSAADKTKLDGLISTGQIDISGKADKVSSATNGNFAALDTNGNLIDSGHKHSDYITSVPVTDIQINNTSIINNGVANIPYASASDLGVIRLGGGLIIDSEGYVNPNSATSSQAKGGSASYRTISPSNQHYATFFGLSKAAGVDLASTDAYIGTYTDAAKGAIQSMLGINSLLSYVQATATADQLYSIGDIFCYNGKLYRATATIAISTTITPGSNCIETTIIDELNNRTIQPASGVSF